jgi:hypothetical protein
MLINLSFLGWRHHPISRNDSTVNASVPSFIVYCEEFAKKQFSRHERRVQKDYKPLFKQRTNRLKQGNRPLLNRLPADKKIFCGFQYFSIIALT